MKLLLFIGIPIFFASLFEGVIFSMPLSLLFVLSWGINGVDRRSFFFAFLAGILVDLSLARPVGLTSLFFLGMVFMVFLYGKKYTPSHFIFYIPFCLISLCVYQLLFYARIIPFSFILSFVSFLCIRFYIHHIYLRYIPPEQMRLEV